MTQKQKNMLERYITKDRIDEMETMSFQVSVDFIDMIIFFKQYVLGFESNNVPLIKCKASKDEIEKIEKKVNENREKYGLLTDEYAYLKHVNYIPNCGKWFVMEQTWFKGMSESASHKYAQIDKTGDNIFEGIYNLLFDNEIYNKKQLLNLFVNELQRVMDTGK